MFLDSFLNQFRISFVFLKEKGKNIILIEFFFLCRIREVSLNEIGKHDFDNVKIETPQLLSFLDKLGESILKCYSNKNLIILINDSQQ